MNTHKARCIQELIETFDVLITAVKTFDMQYKDIAPQIDKLREALNQNTIKNPRNQEKAKELLIEFVKHND